MLDAYRRGCVVGVVPRKSHWTRDWQIAGCDVGSREGISLSRVRPGLYEYRGYHVENMSDVNPENPWAVWDPADKMMTAQRTLRDVRKYFVKKLWAGQLP